MRYAWAVAVIIGLLATSAGLGGGYFLFKFQNTESQLEEAKSQTKALQKEIKSLQEKENQELKL